MKNPFRNMPEQMARILFVFLLFIAGVLFLRYELPPSIKDTSIHVKSTLEREMARPIRYAGSAACADCHEEYELKKKGYHKNLSCETCHGAAKGHTENPTEIKPVVPNKREFCVSCHAYDPSRPTGFPQINPTMHNPPQLCATCHNPHDPKPPSTPEQCEACHAGIARTKAVSPHVELTCTTCHTVPDQHKISPRLTAASIPSEREFCAKCHGKQSTVSGTPKVDLATHGEKYLCWQCHYPHMPEVK